MADVTLDARPASGPSPPEAEMPRLEPHRGLPAKSGAACAGDALSATAVTAAASGRIGDFGTTGPYQRYPGGCDNKENGNALMVKLLIAWANYRRDHPGQQAGLRSKLQGACNRREPRRRSQVTQTKGAQGHQVQRPSDAAPAQHVNAHAHFISLRDRSINLPTYEATHRYQDDRTDGDTQVSRCCAYDDFPQRPLGPSGQHPVPAREESWIDLSRLATKREFRQTLRAPAAQIDHCGGSIAGRRECSHLTDQQSKYTSRNCR